VVTKLTGSSARPATCVPGPLISRRHALTLISLLVVTVGSASADEGAAPSWTRVGAQLKQRCVKCHGPLRPGAELNLSNAASLALGGESGPPVVPGNLDQSLLWRRIADGEMPPDEPLPAAEQKVIRRWIEEGAPGLPSPDDPATRRDAVHWAFRSVERQRVPEVASGKLVPAPIDRFVQARLEPAGLSISRQADRATLLRRLCFDLTGLPPAPAQIGRFQTDRRPDTYERMLDRYLASPRYGVRWGKYWLDAVGYADSNGYFAADSDRPLAYRYRDWVIRKINEDQPYDEFVVEQLAGDEIVGYRPDSDVTSQMVAPLSATHFLRNAPDGSDSSDGNSDEVRIDRYTVLEGTLEITMNCLMGVTIQCARCHDHKFEPVTQSEYYSLQAVFFGAYNPDRWTTPRQRIVRVGTVAERESYESRTKQIDDQIKVVKDELYSAGLPHRLKIFRERLKDLEPDKVELVLRAWETPQDERNDEQKRLVGDYKKELELSDEDLAETSTEFAAVHKRLRAQIQQHEQTRPAPLPEISVLVDTDSRPADHHVLVGGQHHVHGDVVQPGVPAAFSIRDHVYAYGPDTDLDSASSGRRLAFARWVASGDNPLFARVMANRIWMHHFGKGLVATPANLGLSGSPPSHPELLDYLAVEFIRSGWSVKRLHRAILASDVYRQDSAPRDDGLAEDQDNRLLWRYPLQRLSAEAVRDAMLSVSGQLDEQMYGPYVPILRQDDGQIVVDANKDGVSRRSIFLQQRRTQVLSMLELFDAPVMVTSCPRRNTSTVPLQSLAMLNSQLARDCAGGMARRLQQEAGAGDRRRIEYAMLLAAGREVLPEELGASEEFLGKQRALYAGSEDAERRVWVDYCQMLLAGTSVLYTE